MMGYRLAIGFAFLGMIAAAGAAPASAEATAPTSGGRFLFEKQVDGFVRLDTQTGTVSLCARREVGLACQDAPEDRALLEREIARLQTENAALKKDLLTRGLPLPEGAIPSAADAPAVAQNNNEIILRLPSNADIDRMVAYAGHVWHQLVDAVTRVQRQILNKS